jgi:hypothetical protein
MRWFFPAILSTFLLVVLLAACATVNVKPISATGLATVTLSTYHAQAKQTEAMSNRTNLTDAQREIIRRKKAIILKVDPKIKAYGRLIAAGGVPTEDQVQEISNLIDDLVAAGSL